MPTATSHSSAATPAPATPSSAPQTAAPEIHVHPTTVLIFSGDHLNDFQFAGTPGAQVLHSFIPANSPETASGISSRWRTPFIDVPASESSAPSPAATSASAPSQKPAQHSTSTQFANLTVGGSIELKPGLTVTLNTDSYTVTVKGAAADPATQPTISVTLPFKVVPKAQAILSPEQQIELKLARLSVPNLFANFDAANPLACEGLRNLLHGKINGRALEITLTNMSDKLPIDKTFKLDAHKISVSNTKISGVALSIDCDSYELVDTEFKNAALSIDADSGTIRNTTIAVDVILAGNLGATTIAADSKLHCSAPRANFLETTWKGLDETPTSIQAFRAKHFGLVFREDLASPLLLGTSQQLSQTDFAIHVAKEFSAPATEAVKPARRSLSPENIRDFLKKDFNQLSDSLRVRKSAARSATAAAAPGAEPASRTETAGAPPSAGAAVQAPSSAGILHSVPPPSDAAASSASAPATTTTSASGAAAAASNALTPSHTPAADEEIVTRTAHSTPSAVAPRIRPTALASLALVGLGIAATFGAIFSKPKRTEFGDSAEQGTALVEKSPKPEDSKTSKPAGATPNAGLATLSGPNTVTSASPDVSTTAPIVAPPTLATATPSAVAPSPLVNATLPALPSAPAAQSNTGLLIPDSVRNSGRAQPVENSSSIAGKVDPRLIPNDLRRSAQKE